MPSQFDETNRGTLSRSKNKTQDSHADYTGKINVDGEEYWLNGWRKQGQSARGPYDFISLSVKPVENRSNQVRQEVYPEDTQQQSPPQRSQVQNTGQDPGYDSWDDDIPFN